MKEVEGKSHRVTERERERKDRPHDSGLSRSQKNSKEPKNIERKKERKNQDGNERIDYLEREKERERERERRETSYGTRGRLRKHSSNVVIREDG